MKWLLFIFISLPALGFDNPHIMRSPKALLMGDAFTAVNDDEYTLFYNPVSMARHKRDFTLVPFNPQFSATNILTDGNRFDVVGADPVVSANALMDYPVHAQAGISPGFKIFNVGVTFIANESYDLLLRNRTHPMLDMDIRSDKGLMMGVGLPIGPGRIGKSGQGSQTSVGLSAKYLERTGLEDTLALTGTTVLDTLSQSELDKIMRSLGKVRGIGWGFDAGMEHVVRSGRTQFITGLSALDINGTDFKVQSNPDKLKVANNRQQVNLGMALGQNLSIFNYIISADIRDLSNEMEFGRRVRLGAQVGISGLKIMAGMNSGYYSYGAMLDMKFTRLTVGFYDQEVGSKYKQIQSKRFVVYLSLFDFSFDA